MEKNRQILALTKRRFITVRRLSREGLALSVIAALASSPKGGALGRPGHFLLDARGPIWRKRAGLATEGRGQQDASGSEADAGSRNPGSFLSYPYCIRFHPETQGHLP